MKTGTIINGRYRIVRLLGQGGFGAVYRAWDTNLNHARALKVNLETSLEAQRQFQREASTLAKLSHSNLPRVTDYFFVEGQGQFLVMDYVDGEDLEAILKREGTVDLDRALTIVSQVADALGYLHRQEPPIIHQDIKPANIRITPDGDVFLVDFGLVKVYDEHLRTTIGARAVTPGYSPPEQYGQGNTDARTDVYALAATLYSMLTGEEQQESVQRIVDDALLPAVKGHTAVPQPMRDVLVQAMSLNPSQRYQAIGDFVGALQADSGMKTVHVDTAVVPQQGGGGLGMATAAPPAGTGVKPVWWVLGTTVLLTAVFFFILPNTRQQAAQELAGEITRQANSTRLVQTSAASTMQAAATSTAQMEATMMAVEATETIAAQSTALAIQAATARAEATATGQAWATATAVSARATSSARATATQLARSANATATVNARNSTLATVQAPATRVFGPNDGTLAHVEDGYVSTYFADANLKNLIVEATFVNPYSTSIGSWDYGFLFRDEGPGEYRLVIDSDRGWALTDRSDDN